MDEQTLFLGRAWMGLDVRPDGECFPPAATPMTDVLRCERAYHLGPNVYSVTNMTKFYQCFVQLQKAHARNPQGRCNHTNCHWQSIVENPKPCKHIRYAVRWHVKLVRRTKRLARRPRPLTYNVTTGQFNRKELDDFLRAIESEVL